MTTPSMDLLLPTLISPQGLLLFGLGSVSLAIAIVMLYKMGIGTKDILRAITAFGAGLTVGLIALFVGDKIRK